MKHLVHSVHHPHLKKRAILEFIGLGGLMAFIIFQRDIMKDSFITVLEVEVAWFLILMSCYWLILPLTTISYKYISPKPEKIKLSSAMLAHLAGAGPGRIIPGGIGSISINAMHLKKTGLTIEQAIGVVVTNNIFGLLANNILLIGILIIRPDTVNILQKNISSSQVIIAGIIAAALIVLLQWLVHARGTRKEIHKAQKQWRKILLKFLRHPKRVLGVLAIAFLISLIHAFMLDFSAFALNISLSFTDAFIALSFGIVIGSIFPTPGGIGGVEAGITGALVALGYDAPAAASVAVLFRVATYWQPLLPGTLSYLYLREKRKL